MTNTSGPACANLPGAVRAGLSTVPAPAADDLCGALLENKVASTCDLGAMIEWALSSTADKPPRCRSGGDGDGDGPPPEPLADLRPLPAGAFANASALAEEEGATYYT